MLHGLSPVEAAALPHTRYRQNRDVRDPRAEGNDVPRNAAGFVRELMQTPPLTAVLIRFQQFR